MNLVYGDALMATVALLGGALALRARSIRDWLVHLYANQQFTNHLNLPGNLLTLRLIGGLVFLLGAAGLAAQLAGQVSN